MKTLKIALRNLLKNKLVSAINLLGLTLGIVVSLLLLAYVEEEKNTDTFLSDYTQINMLTINGDPYISKPMVAVVKNSMPDVPITYFGTNWAGQVYLADEDKHTYRIANLLDADSSFFQVFGFETLYGDTHKAFAASNKIVLSEDLATKIFGKANPVGKELHYNTSYLGNEIVEVVAVLKKMPANSSWKFDAVLSMQTNDKMEWYKRNANRWGSQNYSACCRLLSNMSYGDIEGRLKMLSQEYKKVAGKKEVERFGLEPYANTYFSAVRPEIFRHGNASTMTVLQLIAFLMLLMATINYVNLVSAQRQKRNKSIAIIKMLGSEKWGVVKMFLAEAGLLLIGVGLLSFITLPIAVDVLNNLMSAHYTTQLFLSPSSIFIILSIMALTFIITGLIPGLIFSRHQALKLLKPDLAKQKSSFFRNSLPITQFTVSIALIICLFAIKKQNDMMLNQNIGIEKEHIIYANTSKEIRKSGQAFINEIKSIAGVSDITFADASIFEDVQHWGLGAMYKGEPQNIGFDKMGVTANFFDFFGLKLKEGTLFEVGKKADNSTFVVNENTMQTYGFENRDNLGFYNNGTGKVIGVLKDFNLKSAHNPIAPLAFMYEGNISDVAYIKIQPTSHKEFRRIVGDIEAVWQHLSPKLPLEYAFLDDSWSSFYVKEIQFQKTLNYAGFISLFIACLGLFGLSVFVVERRTKEIGIRKINGATIPEILRMLNKSFIKWIVVAFVIATPIAYYTMNKWLENFAYKTALSWWIFALAGLSALLVALLAVSWQSWRAASRNPVEALRYE